MMRSHITRTRSNDYYSMDLKDKKILLTGGGGFLGSHVYDALIARGVPKENITIPRSKECDLRIWENCERAAEGQEIVIHLAANVGGIGYNKAKPGELSFDNVMINTQMMEAARRAGVEKYLALGTICSYPKFTPVPFKEEDLWNGYPEETNAPYGLAKKMMLVQAQAYRQQYGFNAISLMPVNLYGPRDHFNLTTSHVIPAIVKKISDACEAGHNYIEVWGTGTATREFLYAPDAAQGILLAVEKYDKPEPINLGSGQEITIKHVVEKIAECMNFTGELRWAPDKPDGQPRRCLDITKAQKEFGFKAPTPLDVGLRTTIDWYAQNH